MNDIEAGGSNPAVGHRVTLKRGRVVVFTDTRTTVGPVTHTVVGVTGVLGLEAESSGVEVTPSFTHTTGLEGGKTVDVQRTASKTVGETVSVLITY